MSYEFKLEYEGLHLICFKCGKYGHRADFCGEVQYPIEPTPVAMQEDRADVSESVGKTIPEIEIPRSVAANLERNHNQDQGSKNPGMEDSSVFGPWMLVKRIPRRKQNVQDKIIYIAI